MLGKKDFWNKSIDLPNKIDENPESPDEPKSRSKSTVTSQPTSSRQLYHLETIDQPHQVLTTK